MFYPGLISLKPRKYLPYLLVNHQTKRNNRTMCPILRAYPIVWGARIPVYHLLLYLVTICPVCDPHHMYYILLHKNCHLRVRSQNLSIQPMSIIITLHIPLFIKKEFLYIFWCIKAKITAITKYIIDTTITWPLYF